MGEAIYTIMATAIEARQAFEQHEVPKPLLRSLYLEQNPSFLDIDRYLDFADRIFPTGNCGLATVYLKHLLGEGELADGEYITNSHQFLEIGKLVVDITADQFGGPKVYVGPLELPWSLRAL